MSVDEALLERAVGDEEFPPTLRLYRWSRPTLSLGRAQELPAGRGLTALDALGVDLVRRPTGGLAVLHDVEWTYSVVARLEAFPGSTSVLGGYERIATALRDAVARLGAVVDDGAPAGDDKPDVASCFAWRSHHEVAAAGRKLIGSAQRRRRDAFLQHGSMPLRLSAERLQRVLGEPVDPADFTDLERVVGGPIEPARLVRAIREAFSAHFGALTSTALSNEERQRAVELYSWKYVSTAWLEQATTGEREQRWGPAWTV